jgi:hypothetical protein
MSLQMTPRQDVGGRDKPGHDTLSCHEPDFGHDTSFGRDTDFGHDTSSSAPFRSAPLQPEANRPKIG